MTHQKAAAGVSRGFDIRQANNVAPLSVNFTMALERPRPGGRGGAALPPAGVVLMGGDHGVPESTESIPLPAISSYSAISTARTSAASKTRSVKSASTKPTPRPTAIILIVDI